MEVFLLFSMAVISSGSAAPLYKRVSAHSGDGRSSALIPLIWFTPLAVIFGALSLTGGGYDAKAVLPALLSGAGVAAAANILIESFKRGSYTLAVIIVNLNFYIPILLSWIFLGEKATALQLLGILILTLAIVALNIKKNPGKSGGKPDVLSVVMPLAACLANGLMNFGIKLRQYLAPDKGSFGFFALCYLFGAVFCLIIFLAHKIAGGGAPSGGAPSGGSSVKRAAAPALLIGLCTGVCYLSISLLSRYVNAASEFTVVTTLSLLLSLIVGWVKYKEKFNLKSALSLLCFLGAIVFQFVSY